MREVFTAVCLLCSVISLELRSQTFVDNSVGLPRSYGWSTSVGDYDADGRLDLLCFDSATQFEPLLYRFQEDRRFAKVSVPFAPNNRGWVNSAWADFNGDGRLDLLLSASSQSNQAQAAIWLQNPDGTFTEQPYHPAGNPRAWSDLDNDGRLDILSDSADGGIVVYWNDPGAGFANTTHLPLATLGRTVEFVDLDNDADLDLALPSGQYRRIYRNDGFRHFVDTGVLLGSGGFADMNGDGWLDCFYSKEVGYGWSNIVQFSQGNFRFQDSTLDTGYGIFHVIEVADFSSEGLPDLFLIAYPRGIGFLPKIYLNKSSLVFEQSKLSIPPVMEVHGAIVADFDGDAALDFLGFGPDATGEQHRHVFRNTTPVNWSLAAPTNLSAHVRRDTVDLAWAPGDFIPCTFNLRIGTSPGAQDIVSSASRADGHRLIPAMGNAQTAKSWHIRKLSPGTYYWSVQAVDWGFRGSSFSEERSFTVVDPGPTPSMPVLSEFAAVFTDEDVATVAIPFNIGPNETVADLSVSVESDNPTLTSASGIELSGGGSGRSLVISPGKNESGTATVTVRVTDLSGQAVTRSFILTVAPVNDSPRIDPIPNQVTYLGAPPLTIPLSISDAESKLPPTPIFPRPLPEPKPPPGSNLTLRARSSDPQLVADSGLEFIGSSLQVAPLTNRTGSVTIQITVSDGEAEASTSFVLLILQNPFQRSGPVLGGQTPLWADFNNDGRLDLLTSQSWPLQPLTRLFWNSSNGLVESGVSLPPCDHGAVVALDFDRDNDLDLLMIAPEAVFLLRNNGDATFTRVSSGTIPKIWFPTILTADVDNDGDPDVFVTGSVDGPNMTSRLFINDNGTFRNGSLPIANVGGSFQFADIDHDGWLDFLASNENNLSAARYGVYRGIGGGRFAPLEPFPAPFEAFDGFNLVDINSDGWLDLVEQSTAGFRLYRNHSGQFELVKTIQSQPRVWVDLDNDGNLDFLSGTNLFRNETDFEFTPLLSPLAGLSTPGAGFADVNNDGALDTLVGLYNSALFQFDGLQLYTNRLPVLNSPPSAPRNLGSSIQGQQVVLFWSLSEDLNQRSGFTYNVRVGTTPGSSDVLSASALPGGKLLFVGPGNTGGRTSLILTNLTREAYYWSVQAIDNNLAGGPFAPEQRFLVPQPNNLPPVISDPGTVTLQHDSSARIGFTIADDLSPLDALTVKVFPSDPLLLPPARLVLSTTNHADYLLTIVPASGKFGSAQIRIQASDLSGGVAVRSFQVIVEPNHPPLGRTLLLTLPEDSTIRFVPTTDPDGDPLVYSVALPPYLGDLIWQSDAYLYVPRTNAFGFDSAVIRARDPSGLTALVQVNFEITPIPDAASVSLSFRSLNGFPFFTLHGEPYAFYVIESSPDLQQWTPSEPLLSQSGEITFKPVTPAPSARFYRARRVE